MQGKTACNGWTFWHFEAEGVRKPIDVLREEARRQLGLLARSRPRASFLRPLSGVAMQALIEEPTAAMGSLPLP